MVGNSELATDNRASPREISPHSSQTRWTATEQFEAASSIRYGPGLYKEAETVSSRQSVAKSRQ
jgi:hypothetical protein